ncbi:hypothetical protein [Rhizobium leguminosarum]|uniref:hypothetical protein n=1 Tax=Rhizobium leguminosarum TaxID=384 RepID=UPI00059FDE5B|nr:hypothetical protein [Rhizobium leguminosarum]
MRRGHGEAERLKTVEDEDTMLKRFLADVRLDMGRRKNSEKEAATSAAQRQVGTHLLRHRQACKAIGVCLMTIRYESRTVKT